MQITGRTVEPGGSGVHTIDVWFSERRGVWVIERLDAEGHLIGAAHWCESRENATACVAEWLRAHDETGFVAHLPPGRTRRQGAARRKAA